LYWVNYHGCLLALHLCCYCCCQVTLGSETRLVQLTANSGYGDLLAQVSAKFPNAGEDQLLLLLAKPGHNFFLVEAAA
jgi:hypothetical protein